MAVRLFMLRRARSGRSTNRGGPKLRWIGLDAIGVCAAASASASDGVFEVDQVCDVETGCAPGDLPGSPSASARLEAIDGRSIDRPAPDANTNVIEMRTPLVTLDLAGFSIIGPAGYAGPSGVACAPPGTGVGIPAAPSVSADYVSVSNGHVRGMTSNGVVRASNSLVRGVKTEQNCGAGITVVLGSNITQSTARENGVDRIVLDRGSRVGDSVVDSKGANGIRKIGGEVLIHGCTANANVGDGINVGSPDDHWHRGSRSRGKWEPGGVMSGWSEANDSSGRPR